MNAIAIGPDGALWFGTSGGASLWHDETWTTYTPDNGLAGYQVRAITVASDGAVWFATNRGISCLDGEAWTSYTTADGLGSDDVCAIALAPDDTVWVGTSGGISRFDGTAWTAYMPAGWEAGAWEMKDWVTALAVAPDGTVWLSRWGLDPSMPECIVGRGLFRFDGQNWTRDNGPGQAAVHAIQIVDGVVWFGTDAGLSRLDGQSWTNYATDDR